MADNQITPFQLTDQFTMDNFNQRINETNTALQNKAPAGFGWGDNTYGFFTGIDEDGSLGVEHLEKVFSETSFGQSRRFSFCDYPYMLDTNNGCSCTLHKITNEKAIAVFTCVGPNSCGPIIIFRHRKAATGWGPPEYLNPPMYEGIEYRTVKRHNGKAVYTKMVNCGAGPKASFKTIAHEISNISQFVSVCGTTNLATSIPYVSDNTACNHIWVGARSNAIILNSDIDFSGQTCYVTLEYTKTTD